MSEKPNHFINSDALARRLCGTLGSMRIFALPVGWIIGVMAVVAMGFRPDPYLEFVRQIPPPHPYPTQTILWILLFMTAQVSVAFVIFRPNSYHHSWGRALVVVLTSFGFFIFAASGAMHAPPSHTVYLWWLLVFCVVAVGLFLWPATCAVRRHFWPNNSFTPDVPECTG